MVPTTVFWAVSITATASSLNSPTYTFGAAATTPVPVQNSHPAIRAEIPTVIATRLRMLASLEISSSPLLLTGFPIWTAAESPYAFQPGISPTQNR